MENVPTEMSYAGQKPTTWNSSFKRSDIISQLPRSFPNDAPYVFRMPSYFVCSLCITYLAAIKLDCEFACKPERVGQLFVKV